MSDYSFQSAPEEAKKIPNYVRDISKSLQCCIDGLPTSKQSVYRQRWHWRQPPWVNKPSNYHSYILTDGYDCVC